MEHQPSPAELAASIAARQTALAAKARTLREQTRPAALSARAREAIRAEVRAVALDDFGRPSKTAIAVVAATAALVIIGVVRLAKR
jgi:hypothetical protein